MMNAKNEDPVRNRVPDLLGERRGGGGERGGERRGGGYRGGDKGGRGGRGGERGRGDGGRRVQNGFPGGERRGDWKTGPRTRKKEAQGITMSRWSEIDVLSIQDPKSEPAESQ